MNAPTSETNVTLSEQLAETFGLGQSLGEIKQSLGHVARDVSEVKTTTNSMSSDLTTIKVQQATQGEQIVTLFRNDAARQAELQAIRDGLVPRIEFDALKTEIASGRLSWPKVATLITALGGIAGLFLYFDNLTPGT